MVYIKCVRYCVRVYPQSNGRAPFSEWIATLDKSVRVRINARIARFEDGHFGDHRALGGGIFELRFFLGPGYRVYFAIHECRVILLLIGGDKATQPTDVKRAKEFFKSYLEDRNANKKS